MNISVEKIVRMATCYYIAGSSVCLRQKNQGQNQAKCKQKISRPDWFFYIIILALQTTFCASD